MTAKKPTAKVFVLLFAIATTSLTAQTSEESKKAGFKLSLSYYRDHGDVRPTVIAFIVTLTNTSKETIYETPCSAFGGLYKLSVVLNGIPVEEPDEARTHRESMERGEANGGVCTGSSPGRRAAPGESLKDVLRWNADKEGTYQFTVERKTFPQDPKQSVIVRSNTVTVMMPEPKSEKPD